MNSKLNDENEKCPLNNTTHTHICAIYIVIDKHSQLHTQNQMKIIKKDKKLQTRNASSIRTRYAKYNGVHTLHNSNQLLMQRFLTHYVAAAASSFFFVHSFSISANLKTKWQTAQIFCFCFSIAVYRFLIRTFVMCRIFSVR